MNKEYDKINKAYDSVEIPALVLVCVALTLFIIGTVWVLVSS